MASERPGVAQKYPGPMKISVAMTTFNGARFIAEQLDSIFAQSRLPDEIVVCDDQSNDQTPQLLQEYAERASFPMRVITNEERLGSIKNFEKAVGLCSGDVIVLCDQDDIWRSRKLAAYEVEFAANPALGVVLTNADLIDEHGKPLHGDLWSRSTLYSGRRQALRTSSRFDLLLGLPFTTGATMAFRSRFKPLVMPFPATSPTFQHDRWIAILIAAVGDISLIAEKLIAYRLHREQQTGLGKVALPLKFFMPFKCWSDAAALEAMDERFKGRPSWTASPEFKNSLAARRSHIAARERFSRNPLRRLAQVVTEYRSGRYLRYPFGSIMALQDIVIGPGTAQANHN